MALLNYPGAKWGMADEVISIMPPRRTYVEPFFGSGAVFFKKLPSAIETINDIDGEVVNFFRVMRERPQELARLITLTPYARDVFDDAHGNQGADELDFRGLTDEEVDNILDHIRRFKIFFRMR